MEPITGVVALLCLATVSVLVVTRLGHAPGEQRTHLFETADGERVNPVAAFSTGAARSAELCDNCGTTAIAPPADYCVDCVGDD